jgi:hypothetical protein
MLIIADDQMGPEEIDIHEVKGLSIGTEIEGFGYVVFTKTRATNKAFYRWFLKVLFTPRIVRLRVFHG